MELQATISSGKGFRFVDAGVIHETNQKRVSFKLKYVPDGHALHHVELRLRQEKKKPSQSWEEAEESIIILTTEERHRSLNQLFKALKAAKELYATEESDVVVLGKNEVRAIGEIGEANLKKLSQISEWLDSPEGQSFLMELDSQDLDTLHASVKHTKNKKALIELEQLVDDEVKEQGFQKWINENPWVFGTEYIRKIDTTKIGIHSEADFIVESLDGFTDLIELKRAGVPLFVLDASHKCYYPSAKLSQVIGQAIHYKKTMEDQRHILKDGDDMDVLKPRVKVVVGRSVNLEPKEKEALRLLNDTLHGIEIITYDEILGRARKIIAIYDKEK